MRLILFSLLFALFGAWLVVEGMPKGTDLSVNLAAVNRLPEVFVETSQHQALDFSYHAGLKEQLAGQDYYHTLGARLERSIHLDLCGQTTNADGDIYDLFIGVTFSELKALLRPKLARVNTITAWTHNPVFDSATDDLPGFVIEGNAADSLTVSSLDETDVWVDDGGTYLKQSALIWNDRFTVRVSRERTDCQYGGLVVQIFKHRRDGQWLYYFWHGDQGTTFGQVAAGFYPQRSGEVQYTVQSLAHQLRTCGLMKQVDGRWQFASRYLFSAKKLEYNLFEGEYSTHCQQVLKTFYHTPVGLVVRERAEQVNQSHLPLAAIGLVDDAAIMALSGAMASPLKRGDISAFQDILLAPGHSSVAWYQSARTSTRFEIKVEQKGPFQLYVLGRDMTVEGAEVIKQESRCTSHLCANNSDVALYTLKVTSTEPVVITVDGLEQTSPLLKRLVVALDAPPETRDPHNKNLPLTVMDRHGERLSVGEIPHLMAPYGGRLNSAMGELVQLTLDKSIHTQVQRHLDTYLDQLPEKPARASVTIANARGELLALAQSHNKGERNWARDGYLQSYSPIRSDLTFWAGYHDGSSKFTSGSVLKLLSSLLLVENLGADNPYIKGLSLDEWQQRKRETGIAINQACFPYTCIEGKHLKNFKNTTIKSKAYKHQGTRYGLLEAMRDSLNSYFAFMVSHFIQEPIYGQSAYGHEGFAQSSPLRDLASEFGFYSDIHLDAGLLEDTSNSILTVPESGYHYYLDTLQYYRAAVGEQTHVTPIQITQMTLAIANQHFTELSLLKSLDGRAGVVNQGSLTVSDESLDYVAQGMKKAAKAYVHLKDLPIELYAKSGTGEVSRSLNNAWLTAFFNPQDPVVITCQMAGVKETGGQMCGEFLKQLLSDEEVFSAYRDTGSDLTEGV